MTDTTMAAARPSGRSQIIVGWVLSGLFIAFMLFDVGIKLAQMPMVEETGRTLGLPARSGFALGVLEAILLALYLYRRTAVLGAVLFTGLFGGTMGVHLVAGNPLFSHFFFGTYLALFAWGGLWLRDAKLREIFPLRR